MNRREGQRTEPAVDGSRTSPGGSLPVPSAPRLQPEQVRRLGALIADGRGQMPADLAAADQEALQREVRRQLRRRLVQLIARAVAANLRRGTVPGSEVLSDDRTSL